MTSTTKITHFKAAEKRTLERNSRVERSVSRAVFQYAAGAVVVLLLASLGWAQKDMGTIVGSVKDSSGALVADAKVMVTDVDRGTSFETKTNSSGEYVAGPMKVGNYRVLVEKTGFKKTEVGPLVLNVQARLAVDVTLQVGTLMETMTVNTALPQLETETSDLGQVVDSRRATTLPLNGRNYAQLALLGAGVAPSEPGSRTESSFGFSSNGARALQNNYLLDGVDNNANLGDVLNGSAYVIQPSVDAIAEFKVQTNAYSSEFGRGNGAIMNAVIKSGTNNFHGSLFEFLRNSVLDARNFFAAERPPSAPAAQKGMKETIPAGFPPAIGTWPGSHFSLDYWLGTKYFDVRLNLRTAGGPEG